MHKVILSKRVLTCLLLAFVMGACKKVSPVEKSYPVGSTVPISVPLGLPELTFPVDNPPTQATIELGRKLFFDPRLSSDNTVSCSSCHNPANFFQDGLQVASGVNAQKGTRNTPSILNAAYQAVQFWDGRAASLEQQAGGPIANPIEMNLPHEVCVDKLNADPVYKAEFARAFGAGKITMGKIEKALASFERTLLSGNSAFDRYQYGGEQQALSLSAQRGLAIFQDKNKGNCATCHTIGAKAALFTDGKFHNLGSGLDANGELKDLGRFNHTKIEADRGAFRTPSLRNVARTAPYMHDGSLKTLDDVIAFYIGGGSSNPHLDPELKPIPLSAQDRADLLAFLGALTDTTHDAAIAAKPDTQK